MNSKIYKSYMIGNKVIKNRIVKSAMFEYGADQGKITARIKELYKEAAVGGAGLIITGMQSVTAKGGYGPMMVETTYEDYVKDMKEIADIVHKNEGVLLVQLQHVGYSTYWQGGYDTFGVNDLQVSKDCLYHEATHEELQSLAKAFAASALRCKEAGCDGIQIHAAHGFLIHNFLSSHFNHRQDCYGGNIENRARLLLEIYDAIREEVGNDFIIGVKIPGSDRVDDSNTLDEVIWVCQELEKKGIDFIEVSGGISMDGSQLSFAPIDDKEGYFLHEAQTIASSIHIPVTSVCGYRNPDYINKVLSETSIQAISLGRPLVKQPDLPNIWKNSNEKAKCISCNRCFGSKDIIACQTKK